MARATADYELRAKDNSGQAFRSFRSNLANTGKALRQFTAVGLAGAAAGATVFAKQTLELADEQTKLARGLGVSTELVSEMAGVLDLAGGDATKFYKGIETLQKNLGQVGGPTKKTEEALAALGTTFEELEELTPEEQLQTLLERLEEVKNETTRTAIANALFGGSARTMTRLVDMGSEAIAAAREQQKEYGNSLTQEAGEAIEQFNDQLTLMQSRLSGGLRGVILDNAESLLKIADAANVVLGVVGELLDVFVRVGEFLGTAAGQIVMGVGPQVAQAAEFLGFGGEDQAAAGGPEQAGGFAYNQRMLQVLSQIEMNTGSPARAG